MKIKLIYNNITTAKHQIAQGLDPGSLTSHFTLTKWTGNRIKTLDIWKWEVYEKSFLLIILKAFPGIFQKY